MEILPCLEQEIAVRNGEHSVGLKEDEGSEEHSVIQKEHRASPTVPISPKARRPLTSKNCLSRMRQGVFHLSLDFSSLEMQSPESAINTPHAFDCHEVPAASIGVSTRWRFLHILHIHAYPYLCPFAVCWCRKLSPPWRLMLLNGQGSLLSSFIVKFHEISDSSSKDAKAKGNSTSQR